MARQRAEAREESEPGQSGALSFRRVADLNRQAPPAPQAPAPDHTRPRHTPQLPHRLPHVGLSLPLGVASAFMPLARLARGALTDGASDHECSLTSCALRGCAASMWT